MIFSNKVLEWIKEFLCSELLYVTVAGDKIDEENIKRRVPVGSSLGPSMFLICDYSIPENSSANLYAFADNL